MRSFQVISFSYLDMQLKPLIFFATGIAISWGATVADVEAGLSNLQAQAMQLDNAINAFPNTGGTLLQALVNIFRF